MERLSMRLRIITVGGLFVAVGDEDVEVWPGLLAPLGVLRVGDSLAAARPYPHHRRPLSSTANPVRLCYQQPS